MQARDEKKQQFMGTPGGKGKSWLVVAAVFVAMIAAAVAIGFGLGRGDAGSAFVKAERGIVALALDAVQDGKAHHYAYRTADGAVIKFFLLKSQDGVIRAAFDACDVCYKAQKGYRQEGDNMICNNCNQQFASNRINEVKGGCNPAPLNRSVEGGRVLLSEQELIAGRRYFPQI